MRLTRLILSTRNPIWAWLFYYSPNFLKKWMLRKLIINFNDIIDIRNKIHFKSQPIPLIIDDLDDVPPEKYNVILIHLIEQNHGISIDVD